MSQIDARFLERKQPQSLLLPNFDAGSSIDISPYDRTPTVSAGATYIRNCLDLDGTSSAVVTYPSANELHTFPLSVFCWLRLDIAPNSNGISVITKASIASSPSFFYKGWYLGYSPTIGIFVSANENTYNKYHTWYTSVTFTNGTWNHVGFTLSTVGGVPKIYINGTERNSTYSGGGRPGNAATTVATTEPVRLAGRGYYEQNAYLNGAIDMPIIANYIFSAEDVKELYRSTLFKTRP